ncbi:MAG: CPBP family intramembrane metalloprotease [Planctomycetes bacterium]|nr:CPBP family intramembrane metalloprotease [Planctomycetota bacterium]
MRLGAVPTLALGVLAPVLGFYAATLGYRVFLPSTRSMASLGARISLQFVTSAAPMLLLFALLAWVAAALSPTPWRERLALRRPRCTWSTVWLAALGSFVPMFLGRLAAEAVFAEPSERMRNTYEMLTLARGPWSVLLIAAIGILPALGEELVYRGFVQSGLHRRWSPLPAMLVPTSMFLAIHLDPMHILTISLGAAWWSFVFWRTQSVLATMLPHLLNNLASGVFVTMGWIDAGHTHPVLLVLLVTVCVPSFLVAAAQLMRTDPLAVPAVDQPIP